MAFGTCSSSARCSPDKASGRSCCLRSRPRERCAARAGGRRPWGQQSGTCSRFARRSTRWRAAGLASDGQSGGLTYDPRAWNVLLGSLFAFSRASRTEQCFRARPAFFAVAASGTLVLVTNRHVVTGRHQANGQPLHTSGALPEELLIHHHSQPVGGWTTLVAPLIGADGLPAWREHPTLGAAADFVVLPAACPVGVSIFGYDVASNADIRIGTTSIVSVIGFPFGVSGSGTNPGFPVWATGFVASGPTEDYNSLPVFLIDCRSRPGQSGSPVIAYRHGGAAATTRGDVVLETGTSWHFLGVYSGRIDPRSDIGMVWKLSSLRELLAVM
jgi:hypothetical protein